MRTEKPSIQRAIKPLVGSIAALLLCSQAQVQAVPVAIESTWVTHPVDNQWSNASNWKNEVVPNSPAATAIFDQSNIRTVFTPSFAFTSVDRIIFTSRADPFTIRTGFFGALAFFGDGVVNNSGVTQNFVIGSNQGGPAEMVFFNHSNAGSNTVFKVKGNDGGEGGFQSALIFTDNSSAGKATLIAYGGAKNVEQQGQLISGGVTLTANGPSQNSALPFFLTGGGIFFQANSQGDQASVILHGNGFLNIAGHNGGLTIGSLAGEGFVFLGSNNLSVGSNNQSTIFTGSIQDGGEGGPPDVHASKGFGTSGSLTKIGTGTLTLNGVNTYTGNTYIDGGTLAINGSIESPNTYVNPGGTLGGNGLINGAVINNGLVSPGNSPGTLTIKDNYSQEPAGGLLIQVGSSTVFDKLKVGGSALLGGTLFVDPLDGAKIKRGEKLVFLTAARGVYGTFDKFEQSETGTILKFRLGYERDDAFLETFVSPFTGLNDLTPNQNSVAKELDRVVNDKRSGKLIDFLSTRPIGELPGDFDKIAAEEFSSIFTLGESFDNVQSLNLQRRTDDIRSGSTGFSAAGLAINGINPSFNGSMSFRTGAAGPNGNEGKGSKEVQQVAPIENRWGAFLTGTGEWVGVGDDFNARGYDIASGGFTVGVDYKVCSHFAVGLMAGYVGTGVDLNDGGRVLVNGGKFGVYATMFQNRQPVAAPSGLSKDSSKEAPAPLQEVNPGFYADVAAVGGYSSYDVHRSALRGTARGDTDGGDLNVLFGAGYDFKKGGFTFGPTASFNYTYVGVDSFNESGSLAPLHFQSQGQESIRTAFGMKASYDWRVGGLLIKPELRAAWQHEYGDATYAIDSSFANGDGNTFTVWGPRIGRDSFLLGAGFAIQLNDRCSTYFYYDGELGRERYDSHNVTGGVRVSF